MQNIAQTLRKLKPFRLEFWYEFLSERDQKEGNDGYGQSKKSFKILKELRISITLQGLTQLVDKCFVEYKTPYLFSTKQPKIGKNVLHAKL